ncbi:MAG: dTMP kinase [Rhodospirillaceae bacterium]|nr:dTMP kinase [Rhodospirillaceae bacterium]
MSAGAGEDTAARRVRGRFITFEGGEGSGKTPQSARLVDWLSARGIAVRRTREPGGTPGAEAIRDLVVKGADGRWSALAETLLMFAARDDHLRQVIRPALEAGEWVVCDRFVDSTIAYQGYGRGLGRAAVDDIAAVVVGDTRPDLTLILDLPPSVGLARAAARRGTETRFESLDRTFHDRLRAGFLEIAAAEPDRCAVVDAGAGDTDAIFAAVSRIVAEKLFEEQSGDG